MSDYRLNAGIVVFNKFGKVLLCKRKNSIDSWQFPQGGIDENETPEQAAVRELKEETSIVNVKLIKTLNFGVRYNFPPEIAEKLSYGGKHYIGQEMYWSLFFFEGEDREINLQTAEPEFDTFCWSTLEQAYEQIVFFKKPSYQVVLKEFSPLIGKYLKKESNIQTL